MKKIKKDNKENNEYNWTIRKNDIELCKKKN